MSNYMMEDVVTDTKEQSNNNNEIKLIIGPATLTEHISNKYNRHIYIFGDIHVNELVCPPHKANWFKMRIDNYIGEKILNTNKDKMIDIFFEIDSGTKKYVNQDSYLRIIREKYKTCYQHGQKQCEYNNVRFHYTDIRRLTKETFNFFAWGTAYLNKLIERLIRALYLRAKMLFDPTSEEIEEYNSYYAENKEEQDKRFKTGFTTLLNSIKEFYWVKEAVEIDKLKYEAEKERQKQYKPIITPLLEFYYGKEKIDESKLYKSPTPFSFETILKFQKITKQINMIPNKEIRDRLLQWSNIKFKEYTPDFLGLAYYLRLLEVNPNFSVSDFLRNLKGKLLDAEVLVMDIYLLTRMFKKFKQRDQEYAEEAKYIVIYAGDFHSNNYREFLNILGFKVIQETKSEDKTNNNFQCLDISQFEQPFFKHNREPISHII